MGTALTASRMRAVEQRAIESGVVTGLALMERAGQGVVEAIFETWPALGRAPGLAGVLCGPGNNGGDGYVVARLLAAAGWDLRVFAFGDPERLTGDARVNHARWCAMGGTVAPISDLPGDDAALAAGLWLDAVFGTGLTRPLPEEVISAFRTVAAQEAARLVAVDILSGLHSDTGAQLSALPRAADLTVTFHAMKQGHLSGDGPKLSGRVVVRDIGL